jgi:hypothetical protein
MMHRTRRHVFLACHRDRDAYSTRRKINGERNLVMTAMREAEG